MSTPSRGPTCPNHYVGLVDLPFPVPKKGQGTCPISKAKFDFEIEGDDSHMTTDKFGNPSKVFDWNVSGEEKK